MYLEHMLCILHCLVLRLYLLRKEGKQLSLVRRHTIPLGKAYNSQHSSPSSYRQGNHHRKNFRFAGQRFLECIENNQWS